MFKSKEEAKFALEMIRSFLADNLELELNEKTQIFKSKQGINLNVVIVYGEIVSRIEFKFIYDRYYKLTKGQNYTESKNKFISETR